MRSVAENYVQFDKMAADMHATGLSLRGTSSHKQLAEIIHTASDAL